MWIVLVFLPILFFCLMASHLYAAIMLLLIMHILYPFDSNAVPRTRKLVHIPRTGAADCSWESDYSRRMWCVLILWRFTRWPFHRGGNNMVICVHVLQQETKTHGLIYCRLFKVMTFFLHPKPQMYSLHILLFRFSSTAYAVGIPKIYNLPNPVSTFLFSCFPFSLDAENVLQVIVFSFFLSLLHVCTSSLIYLLIVLQHFSTTSWPRNSRRFTGRTFVSRIQVLRQFFQPSLTFAIASNAVYSFP